MSAVRTPAEVDYLDGGALVAGRVPRAGSARAWSTVLIAAAIGAALVVATRDTGALVNGGGWTQVARFVGAAPSPDLSAGFLGVVWGATLTTLAYAALGTAGSLALGAVGGVLVSRTWWGSGGAVKWTAARALLSLPRGAHEVVWGLLLINVLGADPWVGVLAIAIPYGAVTARVFAGLLDEVPPAPYRGLRSAGATRLAALMYGLAPQARRDLLSYSFYRFECSIRSAAILGIIGAGGLGYQLALSFQTLRYAEMWTLIYALMALSGAADLWSGSLRKRLARGALDERRAFDRPLLWSGLLGVALVIASVVVLAPAPAALWSERTRGLVADLAAASWPPKFAGVDGTGVAEAALDTLAMSVLAIALAAAAGIVVAFLAASSPGVGRAGRAGRAGAKALLLLCRAVPPPVWALLALFVLFPGPVPGAVALAVYNFGILGRLMTEVVENLDTRPADLLGAAGAPRASRFLYGVMPVVAGRFAALGAYRWEMAMRETVVVGAVGAGGLGRILTEHLAAFDYAGVTGTVVVLVALTFAVDVAGAGVRGAFR